MKKFYYDSVARRSMCPKSRGFQVILIAATVAVCTVACEGESLDGNAPDPVSDATVAEHDSTQGESYDSESATISDVGTSIEPTANQLERPDGVLPEVDLGAGAVDCAVPPPEDVSPEAWIAGVDAWFSGRVVEFRIADDPYGYTSWLDSDAEAIPLSECNVSRKALEIVLDDVETAFGRSEEDSVVVRFGNGNFGFPGHSYEVEDGALVLTPRRSDQTSRIEPGVRLGGGFYEFVGEEGTYFLFSRLLHQFYEVDSSGRPWFPPHPDRNHPRLCLKHLVPISAFNGWMEEDLMDEVRRIREDVGAQENEVWRMITRDGKLVDPERVSPGFLGHRCTRSRPVVDCRELSDECIEEPEADGCPELHLHEICPCDESNPCVPGYFSVEVSCREGRCLPVEE